MRLLEKLELELKSALKNQDEAKIKALKSKIGEISMAKSLSNWSTTTDQNPYSAPELHRLFLVGELSCGKIVRTSPVNNVNGRFVETDSGTIYELLGPNPDFVKFCEQNGSHVPTEQQPIKLKN